MTDIEEKVKKFLPFVCRLSFIYSQKTYLLNIERDDLYQVGSLAIVEACYNYDETKGSFSSHVCAQIKYAMLNYITNNSFAVLLPPYLVHSARLIANKSFEYYQQYGCEPSNDFLIEELKNKKYSKRKITEEYIEYLREINEYYLTSQILSLEELEDNMLVCEENIEEIAIDITLTEIVLEIISKLPDRKRKILEMRLGLVNNIPSTLREISEEIGITYQAAEQSYKKSLIKIREKLNVYD